MKALLIKDLYMLQKQLKSIVMLTLLFVFISFVLNQGLFLISMALVMGTLQVTTAFTFEEMCNWNRFARSLPIKKQTLIASKYILSLALTAGMIVLVTPILFLVNNGDAVIPTNELFALIAVSLTLGLIITAFIIPIYIHFGATKGRIILFAATFILFFSLGMFKDIVQFPTIETWNKLLTASYYAPLFALMLLLLSFIISIKLYNKKQF